ncbi:TPA: Opacity protein opA54, partial [Neisseria meningitidis]
MNPAPKKPSLLFSSLLFSSLLFSSLLFSSAAQAASEDSSR